MQPLQSKHKSLLPPNTLHAKHAPRLGWGDRDCKNFFLKWNEEIRSSEKEQRLLTYLDAQKPVNMQMGNHSYQKCKKPVKFKTNFSFAKIYCREMSQAWNYTEQFLLTMTALLLSQENTEQRFLFQKCLHFVYHSIHK